MTYDFNDIPEMELIPINTVAKARLLLKQGNSPEHNWVKCAPNGNEYLDCEFIITEGEFAKRKIFHTIGLKGNQIWVDMSKRFLKNILESAHGLSRYDKSPESENFRKLNSWSDLIGLEVVIRIGVEQQPNYPPKNKILAILTAENPLYQRIKAHEMPYY